MAFAERAELVARLSLKDDFSGKVKSIQSSLGGLERRLGGIGTTAKQGLGTAITNIRRLGVVAAGGISLAVKTGIDDLAKLEDATTSVDGAIKQMGLTGKLTSSQVAQWANEIEKSVHAAFDDKAITQAATTLLRFGKVTSENLRPALVVMTDLAAKTGSVESAATLLAKALADPEKAAGKLARAGVVLTEAQQDQLKALVKTGDAAGAQALLLDALSEATKGAADASQGRYRKALSTLSDISEDARKALAEGFLPVLERVADVLSEKLADPKVLEQIRGFGQGLADAFDKLLTLGTRLPWQQIGDSLKLAGAGAKAVFDAFAGLPPWIQTAVLTGWGLNKLTGGAGLKIGIDLIKGGLGHFLDRGASPANPMWVATTGSGLGGGGAGVAGAAKGGLGLASKLFLVGEAIGLIAAVNEVRDNISQGLKDQATDIHGAVTNQINQTKPDIAALAQSLAGVQQGIDAIQSNPLNVLVGGDALNELQKMRDELGSALKKNDDTSKANFRDSERKDKDNTTVTQRAIDKAKDATESTRIALNTQLGQTRTTFNSGADRIVTAIQNIPRPVTNIHIGLRTTTIVKVGGTLHAVTSGIEFTGIPH